MTREEILAVAEKRGLQLKKEDGQLLLFFNAKEEFHVCVNVVNERFTIFFAVGTPENIVCTHESESFSSNEIYCRMIYLFKMRRDKARRVWVSKNKKKIK